MWAALRVAARCPRAALRRLAFAAGYSLREPDDFAAEGVDGAADLRGGVRGRVEGGGHGGPEDAGVESVVAERHAEAVGGDEVPVRAGDALDQPAQPEPPEVVGGAVAVVLVDTAMTAASHSHPGSPVLAAVEAALLAPSGTCGPGALTGSCAHCPVPFSTLATLLVCELGACMTGQQQRAALQRQIWQIANEVRGAVDGWDFKQYVLGTLFYRFISEDFACYIQADDDSVQYAELPDDVVTDEIKHDAIKTKGYFIYPSQLFANVAKSAPSNDDPNTDLASIFADIEASANGFPSEGDIKGLFADFDTTSDRLGDTVREKNMRLTSVLKGVEGLAFDGFERAESTCSAMPTSSSSPTTPQTQASRAASSSRHSRFPS